MPTNLTGRPGTERRRSRRWAVLTSSALVGGLALGLTGAAPAAAAASTSSVVPGTNCTYNLTATPTGPGGSSDYSTLKLAGTLTCGSTVSLTVAASVGDDGLIFTKLSGTLFKQPVSVSAASLSSWAQGIDISADPTQDLPDFLDQFAEGTLEQAEDQLLSGPLSIGPKPVLGGACSYSVKASPDDPGDWSSGTVTGTFSCGPSSSPYAQVSLSADWDGTDVTLGDLTGTFAGTDISDDVDQAFSVLDNPADDLGDMVDDLVSGVASQLGSFAQAGFDAADNVASVAEGLNNPGTALSGLDSFCSSVPQPSGGALTLTNPPAIDGTPPTPDCGNTAGPNLDDTTMGPGSQTDRDMDADGSEDGSSTTADLDESGACPELANAAPPDLFVICVPVALAGDFNAGKKSIVLLPGGAILALPVGSSLGAPNTPSIETSGSVLLLGGAIGGINLKLSAKNVEMAATDISMVGSLQISASQDLEVGEVDAHSALGFVPGVADQVTNALGDVGDGGNDLAGYVKPPNLSGTLKAPAQLWGSKVTLDSGLLTIASGSSVTADGLGRQGEDPPKGAITFGGSHIGYGGTATDTSEADQIYDPGQREATYDDPFDPTQPGNGGYGQNQGGGQGSIDYCYGCADTGGGVVSVSSTGLIVDGTISADGDDAGDPNDGGAGAGGSVNVDTGALSGTGSIHANGGDEDFTSSHVSGDSFCCEGQGGGGAVALHYTSDKGFTGSTSAHGGLSNDVAANPTRDFGGAGTVFLQQVASAPAAPSAPSSGSGSGGSGDGGSHNAAPGPGDQALRAPPAQLADASVASSRSVLSGLKLSTAQFSAGPGGGTMLTYRASAAGTARFSVFSTAPGVLKGKTCVKAGRTNLGKTSCTVLTGAAGSFAHSDSAGANSWTFNGQAGGNDLKPGSYEMEATAGAKGSVQASAPFDVLAGASVAPPSASGTSGGTLIIDGGANGDYPVPDGTPLPSGWSSPSRDLVITGGARVLGSDLTFAKVIVSDYGVLTTAPGTTKLTVTAGDVDVERTGRIDMSGHGYEGGNRAVPQDGYGATAPGQTGSQYNNGGSHAGLGGLDGDVGQVAGSTYDNPYDPALPGGGGGGGCSTAGVTYGPSFYVAPNETGGGVLDITAGTLENSGTIAADGQGGNGPIITFPFQFFAECGGAGAGGTVQAHAEVLTGNGSFEANGGDTCIAKLLSAHGLGPCKGSLDAGGGGGGGDVLVVAADHSGFSGQVMARGGLELADPTFVNGTNPRDASGTAGSAILGT